MAVPILRSVRHMLFKEMSVLSVVVVAPSRSQSSGLPPVKTKTINSTIQLHRAELRSADRGEEQDQERPLAVLFGWMLAKRRHLNKYGNLYLSKGFDVLTVQVPPSQVLWPIMAQKRIGDLLDTLEDDSLVSRPLLIHGFSVGGYLYGEMLVKLTSDPQYKHICDRMIGQVFDSPVDFEGVPRGFANILVKNPAMKAALRRSLEYYLKMMHNSVTKHYLKASSAFHGNKLRLPSLFLYSRADPIGVADIIEGVMDQWKEQGIKVSHKCWDHSPHVSHFHHHPDEYVDMVLTFLDSLGLSTPEQQDRGEVEKEIVRPQTFPPASSSSSPPQLQQQQQQKRKIEVPSRK